MPAATVIVKQQQQQPQQQTTKQVFNKCARMRRSGVVADVAAKSNKSNAVDVGAAAVPRTPIAAAPSTARRRKRQQSTDKAARGLVIIIALVLNIMQNQQQQVILHYWPFCNVAFATHTSNNNSHSSSYNSVGLKVISEDVLQPLSSFSSTSSSSTSTAVAAEMPQTEATNNTFKSLAFLASDASEDDSFAYSLKTDVFAEMELAQSLPIFDFGMPRNITGRTGHSEALIKCRVDKLYDKSVSWIRKRDLHILTVGTATYTNDKRFQVTESKDMRDWTLHVKSPQAKDSGIYECQVNTEPKISMAFQLNIVEISPDARAVISGPPDLHFKAGSAIVLSCVVKQPSSKDIGPIYWYRGEQLITPLEEDDGEAETPKELQLGQLNQSLNEVLSTDLQKEFTTRIAMESQLGDTLKSRLRISNAQITDTGIYTCQPTTANSASVVVHVIDDENPAAMQKSTATSCFHKDLQQSLVRILWTIILAIHSIKNWLPKVSTCNY